MTVVGCDNAIFEGTIEENIVLGRGYLTPDDLAWAIRLARLEPDLSGVPSGLQTRLVSGGGNLSRGQSQRILIARAVIDRPSLLLLDEAFTGIDERTSHEILDAIFDSENRWTIVDISHDGAVVRRADTIHVLGDGRIVESGSADELARREGGAFRALFPQLSRSLRREFR